ncbi:MAG: hypothetical protein JW787_05355 [Sedimentisphaerales bacterium]|nr:hypothetical protein [Sedimentisphaerales bacterium]
MVKKSIIAIALISMLATVSYAQDTQVSGQYKVDGDWPATITITYTPVEICRIPIYIKVGMFIELRDCNKKKIVLKQVSCPSGQSFPCYKGCTTIEVRANFEALLKLKLYKTSDIISKASTWPFADNWKAYFRADSSDTSQSSSWIVNAGGGWNKVDVCVEAWDANIYMSAPGCDEVPVGQVGITAVPNAIPDICDYVDSCGDDICDPNDDPGL